MIRGLSHLLSILDCIWMELRLLLVELGKWVTASECSGTSVP